MHLAIIQLSDCKMQLSLVCQYLFGNIKVFYNGPIFSKSLCYFSHLFTESCLFQNFEYVKVIVWLVDENSIATEPHHLKVGIVSFNKICNFNFTMSTRCILIVQRDIV